MSEETAILLPFALRERLLATVQQRLPRKSFGYLLSDGEARAPIDFIVFEANMRNDGVWKADFESYGQYFVDHEDAGFVATPEESWRVQQDIWARGVVEVGVFHTHLRHPANFSGVDFDLHLERFEHLWHMIISLRNQAMPQVRVFSVSHNGVREESVSTPETANPGASPNISLVRRGSAHITSIAEARLLFQADAAGRPKYLDTRAIMTMLDHLRRAGRHDILEEVYTHGFLKDRMSRFQEYIALKMCCLPGGSFQMGTNPPDTLHFCGEAPRHLVTLSPFRMMQVPVTNALFGLFDPRWLDVPPCDRQKPATGVTWFDAAVFGLWMGCRLPTEAEWEFACGGGSEGAWCCADESLLPRYAWYSENAEGEIHPVGTRQANAFGLYDCHGNVWEWCQDTYEPDYYARSPVVNPVNASSLLPALIHHPLEKVCRGGSMHMFSEMCRTRYRLHEPVGFLAKDLGFRLAQSVQRASTEGEQNGEADGSSLFI
jgi:formylglycine-generating enzyme required for sulfatase activity/proteasome lid subunit RPN8/RPN11